MAIVHPIKPIYDENSKVLILGSFPSVKSREVMFYYGHPQNRFWKTLAAVFGDEAPDSEDEKRCFLRQHRIAVWDVIHSCNITGSSDASISDVVVNDLMPILLTAQICCIYCNGDKAYSLYMKYSLPKLLSDIQGANLEAKETRRLLRLVSTPVRLPSTSPANAAWSLIDLQGAFGRIKTSLMRVDVKSPYYALTDYAMDQYAKKLYRLSLDGGFTCPNRDGSLDTRGCIFCDGGSGDFAGAGYEASISAQLQRQKELVAGKLPKNKTIGYIAYFQSFTGTYGDIEVLRAKYEEAIADPEVCILSIATRPDCLGDDVLDLLSQMNERIPVWIELGLQTMHDKTAGYIRRGYKRKVYEQAVKKLHGIGISQIITHVILGLPGETKEMMLDTISYVVKCQSTGIKLSLLHVLEGTDLADDYRAGKFETMDMDSYLEITKEACSLLPGDLVVHRLTGDGNKAHLLAPLWSADKKRVINAMRAIMAK